MRKTIFVAILAFLLLSLVGHYASDTFSPALQTETRETPSSPGEGALVTIDSQDYRALRSTLMLADLIAIGILLGLTYKISSSSSPYNFRAFPLARPSPDHSALFILIRVASFNIG